MDVLTRTHLAYCVNDEVEKRDAEEINCCENEGPRIRGWGNGELQRGNPEGPRFCLEPSTSYYITEQQVTTLDISLHHGAVRVVTLNISLHHGTTRGNSEHSALVRRGSARGQN